MKVKFIPQNVEFEVNPDQSVMKLAQQNGVYIKSICGGLPSCAECRVRVVEGDQNVLPPSSKELTLIGTGYFIDQRRLSCQLKCFGDVTIDLTEQVAKQQLVETRRPQGSKKPETEASHAVSGNLIQQDETLKIVAEDLEKHGNQPRQNNRGGGRQGQGQGQGQNRGGGRNRNRGGGQNQNQKQGSASGSQQNPNQQNRPQQNRGPQQPRAQGGPQGQPRPAGNNQNPNRGNSGGRNGNRGGGQQGRPNGGGGGNQGGRGPGG